MTIDTLRTMRADAEEALRDAAKLSPVWVLQEDFLTSKVQLAALTKQDAAFACKARNAYPKACRNLVALTRWAEKCIEAYWADNSEDDFSERIGYALAAPLEVE